MRVVSMVRHQPLNLFSTGYTPTNPSPKALICLECNLTGKEKAKYCNSDHCPRYEKEIKKLRENK